jgi:antirestriction protein ArdC
MSATPHEAPAQWSALLVDAVSTPGRIADAFSSFWNYSVGNQHLALFQCLGRGIPPGPINTFLGWKDLRRSVRKGERALVLCMPISIKTRDQPPDAEPQVLVDAGKESPRVYRRFLYRANWFTLSQTEGEPYQPQELPQWSEAQALVTLGISRIPFDLTDGNVQGYAQQSSVSISPIAFLPHRTLFHELAHVILGHTVEAQQVDGEHTPRSLREVEAESVALICCESLNLAGAEYSRGYIQHWLGQQRSTAQTPAIPERSAHRIFRAADQILRTGRPQGSQAAELTESTQCG